MGLCFHVRTEFLYRRDGTDYVRCLECATVFDAEDLETVEEDSDVEMVAVRLRR